jgi:hypothetical protein
MSRMLFVVVMTALVATVAVSVLGQFVMQGNATLIVDATFSPEQITPNADGTDDIAEYAYTLSENATISLSFESEDGRTFVFRDEVIRAKGEYRGLFSGVVDGYVLPDEQIAGVVSRRLMPNGDYTWTLTATSTSGSTETRSGNLTIREGDTQLPLLSVFEVSPQAFSPNQDGIRDRVQLNVYLEKDADLDVFLLTENDVQIFIPPQVTETRDGESGRYTYDYDGGVDGGADPPPDGVYRVVAVAQDAVGQRIERTTQLTIESGGKPLAEIAAQPIGADVAWAVVPYDAMYASEMGAMGESLPRPDEVAFTDLSDVTMQLGDVLVFRLTVENYSDVPIRTHGARPGTVYEQVQRAATLGDYDESGAWRVGIDCDTAVSDYPWRWAVGDEQVLETVYDPETDNTYYYLPAGERAVVWGGIRMTELIESRNPQNCWAGLIHEDVAVSVRNSRVGARSIELVDPTMPLYDANE